MAKSALNKHAKGDRVKWIITFVSIILLAVGVAAALTVGFTNANPYGWLDEPQEAIEFTWHEYEGEEDPAPISPVYGCSFDGEILRSYVYAFDIEVINADGTSERNSFLMETTEVFGGDVFIAELKSEKVNGYSFILTCNADFDMTNMLGVKEQKGCNVISVSGNKEEIQAVWEKVIFHGYEQI